MEYTDIKPGALIKLKDSFPGSNFRPAEQHPAIMLHNDFLENKGNSFMEVLYRTVDPPLMYLGTQHVPAHTVAIPKNQSGRLTHHNAYNAHKFLWTDRVFIFLVEEEDSFDQYFFKVWPK